jgi:hypothetical protein
MKQADLDTAMFLEIWLIIIWMIIAAGMFVVMGGISMLLNIVISPIIEFLMGLVLMFVAMLFFASFIATSRAKSDEDIAAEAEAKEKPMDDGDPGVTVIDHRKNGA